MGMSMAGHLARSGYPMNVYTRTASKATPLMALSSKVKLCRDPSEVARNSDVVFSMVGFPSDVRQVADAVVPNLRQGGTFCDFTTSQPVRLIIGVVV
jgi:3-hydroxyisobutyrate dehydrogenase